MTITITATDSPLTERIIQYLRREKVQFAVQPDGNDADVPPTKAEFLEGFRESYLEAKHKDITGEKGQTFEEFLDEMEQELESEKKLSHAY